MNFKEFDSFMTRLEEFCRISMLSMLEILTSRFSFVASLFLLIAPLYATFMDGLRLDHIFTAIGAFGVLLCESQLIFGEYNAKHRAFAHLMDVMRIEAVRASRSIDVREAQSRYTLKLEKENSRAL